MAKKKPGPRPLHTDDHVSWMDRPNLLVPLEANSIQPRSFFPLLRIQVEDADAGFGRGQGLFFDEMHGPGWWQWADRAPTWMDPHKFVAMALEHPRVRGCLRVCYDRNIERPATRDMPAMLDEVMDRYLDYLLANFEVAKPHIVAWLVRNYCEQQLSQAAKTKKPAPRGRETT